MSDFEKIVTNENFEEIIKSDKIVLVDFWATWCGPCRMLSPVVEKIAEINYGKLTVAKADIDECEKTALSLGIMSVPTLKLYVDGECKETWVGYMNETRLQNLLNQYIEK